MNENAPEGWSLFKDGILWRKVVGWQIGVLRASAELFVKQLEASVGSVDFLCGLLLDRIAANCLRQQVLFEVQSTTFPELAISSQRSAQSIRQNFVNSCFLNLLKYESLLNQAFHRDVILLQTLQRAHADAPPLGPKKPSQSDRSLVEAHADVAVTNQAAGSAAVTTFLPQEIELGQEGRAQGRETQLEDLRVDKDNPGHVCLE
jgi:hypothetical protein